MAKITIEEQILLVKTELKQLEEKYEELAESINKVFLKDTWAIGEGEIHSAALNYWYGKPVDFINYFTAKQSDWNSKIFWARINDSGYGYCGSDYPIYVFRLENIKFILDNDYIIKPVWLFQVWDAKTDLGYKDWIIKLKDESPVHIYNTIFDVLNSSFNKHYRGRYTKIDLISSKKLKLKDFVILTP